MWIKPLISVMHAHTFVLSGTCCAYVCRSRSSLDVLMHAYSVCVHVYLCMQVWASMLACMIVCARMYVSDTGMYICGTGMHICGKGMYICGTGMYICGTAIYYVVRVCTYVVRVCMDMACRHWCGRQTAFSSLQFSFSWTSNLKRYITHTRIQHAHIAFPMLTHSLNSMCLHFHTNLTRLTQYLTHFIWLCHSYRQHVHTHRTPHTHKHSITQA